MEALDPPKRILHIAQLGEAVGLGHVKRSMVAVNALKANKTLKVDFVQIGYRAELNQACEHQTADQVIAAKCKTAHYHLIVMDVTQTGMGRSLSVVLASQAKKGTKLVAIDSLPGLESSLDLLYAPSFFAPRQVSRVAKNIDTVYGWDCYLLDVRKSPDLVEPCPGNVLVLTGGSDVHKLGQTWPTIIDKKLGSIANIHWIVGPFSKSPDIPSNPRLTWHEYTGLDSLSDQMQRAEVAITLYGVGFFELLAYGVPTVVYSPYGDKDKPELKEIERIGLSEVAWSAEQAVCKLAALHTDETRRAALRHQMSTLGMKYKAERFVLEVEKILHSE